MKELQPVEVKSLTPPVFQVFGTQNALLTAGAAERCNTMTIGWCQLGRTWNLPTCTVFVRPERYTYQFTEQSDYYTVSVFDPSWKKVMTDCGTRSGRDGDKIARNGLTVRCGAGGAPFFAEAELVLVCKKLYIGDLTPEGMLDGRVRKFYEGDGLHRVYVGEVVEAYQK